MDHRPRRDGHPGTGQPHPPAQRVQGDDQDQQQPHCRDELYLIVSGSGRFDNGGEVQPFGPGDLIFVPAQRPHRFTQFTDDFSTWVVFYGPDGGERP
jgi:mannose-6-phosphate isomerase-like protein (cupin superfamily)